MDADTPRPPPANRTPYASSSAVGTVAAILIAPDATSRIPPDPDSFRPLVHGGDLRADITTSGVICLGDEVEAIH